MSKKHHPHLIALCDKAIRQLNAMGKPQEAAGLIQAELDDIDRLIAEYQRLKANLLLKAENTAALAQKEAPPNG